MKSYDNKSVITFLIFIFFQEHCWGKKNDEVSSGQFEVISLLHMQAEALSLEVRCHHLQALVEVCAWMRLPKGKREP